MMRVFLLKKEKMVAELTIEQRELIHERKTIINTEKAILKNLQCTQQTPYMRDLYSTLIKKITKEKKKINKQLYLLKTKDTREILRKLLREQIDVTSKIIHFQASSPIPQLAKRLK